MAYHRPFLKWAGNKFQCLAHILPHFPQKKRLIEPFAGSAAITLNTDFKQYWLSERNADLVALFHHIQQEGQDFINLCKSLFIPQNNNKDFYLKTRDKFNHTQDPRTRAQLFLFLNRHGYNGLCRYNLKGGYNVPFGHYIKPYFPEKELLAFYEKSKKHTIKLTHLDFKDCMLQATKNDLIYCDPPYVPLSPSSSFTNYTGHGFNEHKQIELRDLAEKISARGATIIISNHDTPYTRELYKNAKILSFDAKRLINCKAELRRPVKEIIAIW